MRHVFSTNKANTILKKSNAFQELYGDHKISVQGDLVLAEGDIIHATLSAEAVLLIGSQRQILIEHEGQTVWVTFDRTARFILYNDAYPQEKGDL